MGQCVAAEVPIGAVPPTRNAAVLCGRSVQSSQAHSRVADNHLAEGDEVDDGLHGAILIQMVRLERELLHGYERPISEPPVHLSSQSAKTNVAGPSSERVFPPRRGRTTLMIPLPDPYKQLSP